MFHPVQQSEQHYPVNDRRRSAQSRQSRFQTSFSSPNKNYIWTKLQKPLNNSAKLQYQFQNDNKNPQLFYRQPQRLQRELPAYSKKIPLRSDFNPFYLQVHNKRRKLDQLKTKVRQQVQKEQLQYLTKLKLQQKMNGKIKSPQPKNTPFYQGKSLKLPLIKTPRGYKQPQGLQDRMQALARAAQNNRELKKHLFGVQFMGRRDDIGAVYQKPDKKQEQKKEQQIQAAWINIVLQNRRKQQNAKKRKPKKQDSQQSQQSINFN